jgi:APA family basic amino acid/polyamine antiporter
MVMIMGQPYLLGMSKDGLIPPVFSKVNLFLVHQNKLDDQVFVTVAAFTPISKLAEMCVLNLICFYNGLCSCLILR